MTRTSPWPSWAASFRRASPASFADGSVQFIDSKKIKDATLHKLINPADGQPIGFDEYPHGLPAPRPDGPIRKVGPPGSGTARPPIEIKKEIDRPKFIGIDPPGDLEQIDNSPKEKPKRASAAPPGNAAKD